MPVAPNNPAEDAAAHPAEYDKPQIAKRDRESCSRHRRSHIRRSLRPQPRTLTARATTRRIVIRAISDWVAIRSFAMALKGIVSVGLNAVAFVYDVYR